MDARDGQIKMLGLECFLELGDIESAGGAVLLEAVVPVHDLLVGEVGVRPQVVHHLRGNLALLLPHAEKLESYSLKNNTSKYLFILLFVISTSL